ncbi:MAG: zinc ribbon domain-containing protein [Clostridiales bacterium]|jgi:hypothetical protein|nr:zinc ribbon domain-containing protein [Clostridiales bacterium]
MENVGKRRGIFLKSAWIAAVFLIAVGIFLSVSAGAKLESAAATVDDITVVTEIKVTSKKKVTLDYESTFTGAIKNNTGAAITNVKLTIDVKTAVLGKVGSYTVTIASIGAGATHILNAATETSDNFETVTGVKAQIGTGASFSLRNVSGSTSNTPTTPSTGGGTGGDGDEPMGVGGIIGTILGVIVFLVILYFVVRFLRRVFGGSKNRTKVVNRVTVNNVVPTASYDGGESKRIALERERLKHESEMDRERLSLEKERLEMEKEKLQSSAESAKPKFCTYCGSQNDGDAKVCGNCGAAF